MGMFGGMMDQPLDDIVTGGGGYGGTYPPTGPSTPYTNPTAEQSAGSCGGGGNRGPPLIVHVFSRSLNITPCGGHIFATQ